MTTSQSARPKRRFVGNVIIYILLLISAIFLTASRYKGLHFADARIEEIIFYFLNGIDGQSNSLFETVQDNLLFLGIVFFILLLPVIDFYRNRISIKLNLSFLGRKKLTNFNPSNIPYKFKLIYTIIVLLISVWLLLSSFGVYGYIKSLSATSKIFEEHYIDPKTATLIFPEKKRNLIHIYLESMENTLMSQEHGGQLEVSLTPELESIALDPRNVSFSNLPSGLGGMLPASGTTWTVAALVAQSGGVPLRNNILGGDGNSMGDFKQFLPGAYTLGDILQKEGYNQTLIIGSVASFGGRDKLFSQHGGYTIKDYDYAKETGLIDKDYGVWWGYEDKKLFEFTKDELARLSTDGKPFNIQLLTADTHFTDGYLDETCSTDYPNQYDNVYSCSSSQVEEFVNWLLEQPFADSTTIVITGDHLGMQTSYYEERINDPSYKRTIYNAFINPVIEPVSKNNRQFTSMDIYPTTLAAMGVVINGDRLGLGTNLFSEKPTLVEIYGGLTELNNELTKRSLYYDNNIMLQRNND